PEVFGHVFRHGAPMTMATSVSLPRIAALCAIACSLVAAPPLAGRTLPVVAVSQTHSPNFGTKSIGQMEFPLSATGGDGLNYAWSLVGGALPPGISIRTDFPSCCFPGTASAGLIGVATTPGTYNFILRVTSGIDTADVPSTVKITALVAKDPNALPDAFVGTPYSY